MANEAIKRYSHSSAGDVIQDMVINNNYAVEKGAFLTLIDARAVSGTLGLALPCAGICAREKIAGDGRTQIAVHTAGDFDVVASGAIAIGSPVCLAGDVAFPNAVKSAVGVVAASGAAILGYSLETASDAEVFQVRLNL